MRMSVCITTLATNELNWTELKIIPKLVYLGTTRRQPARRPYRERKSARSHWTCAMIRYIYIYMYTRRNTSEQYRTILSRRNASVKRPAISDSHISRVRAKCRSRRFVISKLSYAACNIAPTERKVKTMIEPLRLPLEQRKCGHSPLSLSLFGFCFPSFLDSFLFFSPFFHPLSY